MVWNPVARTKDTLLIENQSKQPVLIAEKNFSSKNSAKDPKDSPVKESRPERAKNAEWLTKELLLNFGESFLF